MDNEKKYTEEEMKAIANEEIRKAGLKANDELNPDELENVSGGKAIHFKTHEEIDQACDIVAAAYTGHGKDIAYLTAQELGVLPGEHADSSKNPFTDSAGVKAVEQFRSYLHDNLNNVEKNGYNDRWNTNY